MFCKRHIISLGMYLLDRFLAEMMKTYVEARPTYNMKRAVTVETFDDR